MAVWTARKLAFAGFRSLVRVAGPFILLLLSLTSAASAETRLALVIGNSRYQDAPLKNPANDAAAIADNLKKLGFNVIPIPFRNAYPFGGSIHCATADVYREGRCQDYFLKG